MDSYQETRFLFYYSRPNRLRFVHISRIFQFLGQLFQCFCPKNIISSQQTLPGGNLINPIEIRTFSVSRIFEFFEQMFQFFFNHKPDPDYHPHITKQWAISDQPFSSDAVINISSWFRTKDHFRTVLFFLYFVQKWSYTNARTEYKAHIYLYWSSQFCNTRLEERFLAKLRIILFRCTSFDTLDYTAILHFVGQFYSMQSLKDQSARLSSILKDSSNGGDMYAVKEFVMQSFYSKTFVLRRWKASKRTVSCSDFC